MTGPSDRREVSGERTVGVGADPVTSSGRSPGLWWRLMAVRLQDGGPSCGRLRFFGLIRL